MAGEQAAIWQEGCQIQSDIPLLPGSSSEGLVQGEGRGPATSARVHRTGSLGVFAIFAVYY
jgi:hypothetical protein